MTHPLRRRLGAAKALGERGLRASYYVVAYGREFPGKTALERRLARWELGRGLGDVPKDRSAWDAQYAEGGWDFLGEMSELAHYSVIAGYASHLRPGGSVLDVGCGAGVLHHRLLTVGYSSYVGLDISEVAVRSLSEAGHREAVFTAERAEEFDPGRTFDVVVFNESLTYLEEPARQFARYREYLRPDGVMIVSCHEQSPRAQAILRGLEEEHRVLDASTVAHGGTSWRVVVFAPAAGQLTALRSAAE